MSETGLENAFLPMDAARVLEETARWPAVLVRRTEGATWIVWGLAVPAMILNLAYVGTLGADSWMIFAAWLPWLLAAMLATSVLWRTARLVKPDLPVGRWWTIPAKLSAVAAALALLHFVLQPETMGWPVVVVGAAWISTASVAQRISRQGRWSMATVGALLIAGGAVLEVAGVAMEVTVLAGAAATGLIPIVAGSIHALLE